MEEGHATGPLGRSIPDNYLLWINPFVTIAERHAHLRIRCSACGQGSGAAEAGRCTAGDLPVVRQRVAEEATVGGRFQLKGGGWYATEFKGSGGKPAAKDTDAPSAARTATARGRSQDRREDRRKSDTKVETKAEGKADSNPAAPASPATRSTGSGGTPST